MAKGMPWIRAYTSIRTDPRSLILGRLLSDAHAYTRILDLRLWLADNAPDGVVRGPHAEVVVEEAVGWRGEPGAFATAARDSGFLRVNPARDSDGISLVDEDWAAEQAAHLAKIERDRSKPDGRRKSRAAPVRDSSGESRELRVESTSSASQATAPAPPPEDELPDASAFALEAQEPPAPAAKKFRETPPGEALYVRLESSRRTECERADVPFVPSRWPFSRQNKDLGPIAKLPDGHEDKARFEAAWGAFCDDPDAAGLDEPFSLSFFWKMRSRYEGRGLRVAS